MSTAGAALIVGLLGLVGTVLNVGVGFLRDRRRGDVDERRLDLEELHDLREENRRKRLELDEADGQVKQLRRDLDGAQRRLDEILERRELKKP